MAKKKYILLIIFLIFSIKSFTQKKEIVEIKFPPIILENIETEIHFLFKEKISDKKDFPILINKNQIFLEIKNQKAILKKKFISKGKIIFEINGQKIEKKISPIPLWFSILPPFFAILIALIFQEVFVALFVGIWSGTFIIFFYNQENIFFAFFKSLFAVVDNYFIRSLNNESHLSIIIFSMLIGGMVGIITKNGGMKGVVNFLSKYANTRKSGQLITWLLGIAIFFDDYANTLVVGNTMRAVTDKLKISREKLAYIVDSTAAPVVSIAFVTTWIGAELSYIQDGINVLGIKESAYSVFINSLRFSFYPIFTLIFILLLILLEKDFGPMYTAEKKAIKLKTIKKSAKIDKKKFLSEKWYNAFFPVLTIIFGTLCGLLYTGWNQEVWDNENINFLSKISNIIGNSNSYKSLIWASLLGVVLSIFMTISQKIMSLKDTIESLIGGFKLMFSTILILSLAWSLAYITEDLHTADFISNNLIELNVSPYYMPALTFILSAMVAFSTGSSWGTMAIIYPLILSPTWYISQEFGLDYNNSLEIFYNVVSTVLAGAVFGDHCSPISDTTILSSMASSCNHIAHVKTQLPYALTVGATALFIGSLISAFGVNQLLLFVIGTIILYFIIYFFGKKTIF